MAPLLLILLAVGGVAAAVAAGGSRYALSDDCQTNKLATMTPDEVQRWLTEHLSKAIRTAFEGKGSIAFRTTSGTLPETAVAEIQECQANLQKPAPDGAGLSEAEAKRLCRIDGTTAYFPAEPDDPEEVAMYLYQQVAHPKCATLVFRELGDSKTIQWPSNAAECLYLALAVGVKMELLAQTLDQQYAVTPEDLARVAEVCPQAQAAWGGGGGGGGGVRPSTLGLQAAGVSDSNPEATSAAGMSVGAAPGLDFHRMAADANLGLLHPKHILTGAVFR